MSIELEQRIERASTIQISMTMIAQELNALCDLTLNIKNVYAEAAARNDLTFIKIIEDEYKDLWIGLKELAAQAEEQSRE
ncbi:hypothetical protein [Paenibacillus sinopodophylli]|uniref:hypothetical protein n=1 Tax=Paenibacillus sinopodophylli TaxID=1837342 RepID=UPI00110CEEF9|nr:hypothetical protein [Paenibacillus sinopodophylli]